MPNGGMPYGGSKMAPMPAKPAKGGKKAPAKGGKKAKPMK